MIRMKMLRSEFFEMHNSGVRCMSLMLTLLFLAHLFGCVWSYMAGDRHAEIEANKQSRSSSSNITSYAYVSWWTNDLEANFKYRGQDDWIHDETMELGQRYVASIYWAFTTMTTVGYGDIVPATDYERVYATIIMIMGATIFGFVVGSVSAIANNQNRAMAKESDVMQRVAYHMEELKLSHKLRDSVRLTVKYILTRRSAFNENHILRNLPADLRRETILASHSDIIPNVAIFVNQDSAFVAHLVMLMRPVFHIAGDTINRPEDTSDGIYFLLHGIAEKTKSVMDADGKSKTPEVVAILHIGNFFGHEGFILGDAGSNTGARAFTDCSSYLLLEKDIANVSLRNHSFGFRVRKALKDMIFRERATRFNPEGAKSYPVYAQGLGDLASVSNTSKFVMDNPVEIAERERIVAAIDNLPQRIMSRQRYFWVNSVTF